MEQLTRQDRRVALRDWMEARDGVVTGHELRALGFTRRQIEEMVARGELVRVRSGLFRGRGARWDLRAQLRGALSEQGGDARLVLVSGLHWQGLLRWPAAVPQLGVPGNEGVRRLPHRDVYRTSYAVPEPVFYDGLPCAALSEAVPHLAGRVGDDHAMRRILRRALRDAVRRDAALIRVLQSHIDTARSRGVNELRAALASLPSAGVVRSDLEEDFVAFCEIWGLPRFRMNQKVGGVERDAVRVEERLIVELDTRGYHGNLMAMEADRRRRRRATVAGWRHVEITGYDLRDEPARVAADIAELLGLRGWTPQPDASKRWAAVLASARGVWLPAR